MALPFTAEQFYGVFHDYNAAVWPAQWLLVALGLGGSAEAAALVSRCRVLHPWSPLGVDRLEIYHLAFFARISPAAYGFAAGSAVGVGILATAGQHHRGLKP
jgi:hypothetical protein